MDEKPGIGRAASKVGGATFLSRIFGLVREQIFAALLGAGYYADAFIVAFRIPNLLRDLFAEGALSSAFVPTFTNQQVKNSREEAWAFANLVLGVLLFLLGILTLLGIFFASPLVHLIGPGFSEIPGKHELTVWLTRIMFPFLPIISVAALFMGMLNVQRVFGLPALAPVLFNLVSITFGLGIYFSQMGLRMAVIGWSIGTLVGGFAQALLQYPKLRNMGFRFRPRLSGWRKHAGLRQIWLLGIPAVIGLAGSRVNIVINTILASLLEEGSPSWLNYAFRFIQLPIGVFGVAISVVTLSVVSKNMAEGDSESYKKNLNTSLGLVFLLTIPSALGLWILREPIISLVFEHGRFSERDTLATAGALAFFAIGLPAYAAIKVLTPAFYARKDSKTPMIASLVGVVVNIVFNLLTFRQYGHVALALGTSIGAFFNIGLLFFWMERKHGGLPKMAMLGKLWKIFLACLPMMVLAHQGHLYLEGKLPGIWGQCLDTLVPISLAAFAYVICLLLLRVEEATLVIRKLRKN